MLLRDGQVSSYAMGRRSAFGAFVSLHCNRTFYSILQVALFDAPDKYSATAILSSVEPRGFRLDFRQLCLFTDCRLLSETRPTKVGEPRNGYIVGISRSEMPTVYNFANKDQVTDIAIGPMRRKEIITLLDDTVTTVDSVVDGEKSLTKVEGAGTFSNEMKRTLVGEKGTLLTSDGAKVASKYFLKDGVVDRTDEDEQWL